MITERTIINFLIIAATLILVPFVVSSILNLEYAPAIFFAGLLGLVFAFFYWKEQLCVWPMLGMSIAGSLNFLPLQPSATNIFCVLLILYYVTGYVIIRQKRIKLGKTKLLWPILIITLILIYHNHSLSVGAFGSDTEGAKPALLAYLTVVAYFCGINVSAPSINFLSKVPLYCVFLTALSSIPFFLSTYFPALAPYIYQATTSVNVDAYVDANATAGADIGSTIGRMGVFSDVGAALQLYLLCHYPIGSWLRPERWWVAGVSLICVILAVASGYRSSLFDYAFVIMVATWCHYSWRSLFLPAGVFIAGVLLIIAISNNLINLPENKLPMVAQRSLSFLPGDWDQQALDSAKSSNDFRKSIQDVYIAEYLDESPWIGNGFSINSKEYNALSAELIRRGAGAENGYLEAKVFITGKLFHTGWLSVYDAVGVVGATAFVALGWNEIYIIARFMSGPKANRRSPLFPFYIWLQCKVLTMMVSFFTVYGDFGSAFAALCIFAIVLSQLLDIENTIEVPIVLPEHKGQGDFKQLSGAHY